MFGFRLFIKALASNNVAHLNIKRLDLRWASTSLDSTSELATRPLCEPSSQWKQKLYQKTVIILCCPNHRPWFRIFEHHFPKLKQQGSPGYPLPILEAHLGQLHASAETWRHWRKQQNGFQIFRTIAEFHQARLPWNTWSRSLSCSPCQLPTFKDHSKWALKPHLP